MQISDSFTITAPQEAVWALLEDIPRISACVPGAQDVQMNGENSYSGVLRVKVGPVAASFNGQVRIVEQVPPERIVAEMDAQDKSSASLVKATFTGTLTAADGSTCLDYEMDVALRGKLGQFGGAVVQATARKMTAEFAACLEKLILEPGATG
jgi:hypothetical protein